MTETTQNTGFDFEALYRGESLYPEGHPFRAAFQNIVPWEIGGPQPAVIDLAQHGGFRGRVLDVGCGLGEHSCYLARRGHEVTGIDIAPTAVRRAAARADELGLEVEFLVADAVTLDALAGRTFDTILDWGLYHGFTPAQRRAYIAALRRVAAPGARLQIYCPGELLPPELIPQHPYTADDVTDALTSTGWVVRRCVRATYTANAAFTRDALSQVVAVTSATGGHDFVQSLDTDEQGRLLLPTWSITADRPEDPK